MNLFRKFSAFKCTIRLYSKEILDIEKLFLNSKINNLLQNLIDCDPLKVHNSSLRKRENPTIQLLSNEQRKELETQNSALTKQKLQMPPIKNVRVDNIKILEENDKLDRFVPKGHKFVCVDISIQDKNRERLMVVREANGVLRTVSSLERDRFNQVFFPLPGREIIPPPMFNDDNLKAVMDEGRYAYILDRNCIQFEPDDPIYISICHRVYAHVNEHCDKLHGFRTLSTTRHFGGLVLHLVASNEVGNLLVHLLSAGRTAAVANLIDLHRLVHSGSSSAAGETDENNIVAGVYKFLETVPVSAGQRRRIDFLLEGERAISIDQ